MDDYAPETGANSGKYKPKDCHPDSGTISADKALILIVKILWDLPLPSWPIIYKALAVYLSICIEEQEKVEIIINTDSDNDNNWAPPTSLS